MILQGEVEVRHGPLPSPEDIAGYEKILTGAADRLFKMAEKEQGHRHTVQLRRLRHLAVLTFVGQLFAFSIGVSGVAGGVYLVGSGKNLTGFGVFFTSLATLIGVYIYNRHKNPQAPSAK